MSTRLTPPSTPALSAPEPELPTPPPDARCDALLEAGQAAERRGQRAEARACYERALTAVRSEADGRRASTILRWIARTYVGDAELDAALDCLDAAVAVAEAWHDEAAAGHAMNIQAVVRWQQGDLDEAERLYLLARTRATRAGDAKLAAMTAQNLGVIANVRGELDEARQHYEASLTEYRALGLTRDVTVALNNLGLLHTSAQEWRLAENAFTEAVQLADALGDVSARMLLDVNLAELWVAQQDYGRAYGAVRHAMDLAARTGDASSLGQASKLLGVIARERGDFVDAEEQLRRAGEIAELRQDVLLQAEVARESGELARRQGRNKDVLRSLNRAHRLFSQLRARRDLTDIDRRTGHLEDEFLQVARRWGESIEAKDYYTQGHCVRVADLACAIAVELGMDGQDLFWFRIGALLHDVGKLVIPQEVLNKAGKLTDDEWVLMRSHTTAGVEMVAGVEFPWDVLPIIRSHHERWDGRGYPDQLAGEQIPLVARILCVADVYDALTSARSYKKAFTHSDAVEIMRRDVGVMFDPAVFVAFDRVVATWADRAEPPPLRTEAPAAETPIAAASESAVDALRASSRPTSELELDDLTGMPLRRAFRETAARILEARRTTERPVSLLVIDIDHFKIVNDTFGHLQGDEVLRHVADLVRQSIRPGDFVARYAGDELVVLLPDTRTDEARFIAERLRERVATSPCARRDGVGGLVQVTLSLGVATTTPRTLTLDELFAAADGALYAAKRRGRNLVAVAGGNADAGDGVPNLDVFVGRASEQQRLRRLLDAASTGRPQVVLLSGEAGIGKSTLLRQLGPEITLRGGALVVGRCLEADVRPPYGPWVDAVSAIHALGSTPPHSWRELARLVPALGTDAAQAPRSEAVAERSAARYALMQELDDFLRVASTGRLLVLVLDDLQWGDRDTWDVLDLVVPRLGDQRLLIALTLRAEDVSADVAARLARLVRYECVSELVVSRLSREELDPWLRAVLGAEAPDPRLVGFLAEQSQGNPLFAVQSLRALVEDGALRFSDGTWHYTPQAEEPLPTAVRELLARRLARLSEGTRDILTIAAVFGRQFDADLLVRVAEREEDVVFDAIGEAMRANVVQSRSSDGLAAFEFTHGLLAEVLRRAANPLRLRRVHERVARTLAMRSDAPAVDVASHFARAGNRADALHYALLATDRAASVYAFDSAEQCLALAERQASTIGDQAAVRWRQATLAEGMGRHADAERFLVALLGECAEGAESTGVVRPARRMLQRLQLRRGVAAGEVRHACEALHADAVSAGDQPEAIAMLLMLSQVHGRLGQDADAERCAQAAIAAATTLGDTALLAEAVMRLGSAVLPSQPADTVRHFRQALDLFTQRRDRRGQLRCQINIGVACDRAGNHPAAELAFAAALDIAGEVRDVDLAALASMNLGVLLEKLGRFDEAAPRFEEALRLCSVVHNEPHRLSALYNLAHLARERGDAASATELYGAAEQLARQLGHFDVQAGAVCGIGLSELALGQSAAARERLHAARALLATRTQWFQGRELFVALEWRLHIREAPDPVAVDRLAEVLNEAERFDAHAAVWLAAEFAAALSDPDRAPAGWPALATRYAMTARAHGYVHLWKRLSQGGAEPPTSGHDTLTMPGLATTPLSATPLGATPLGATPLGATPPVAA